MEEPQDDNRIPLNISGSIDQQATKATAQGFVDKDAVGLYAQTYRAMWFAPVTKDSEIDAADVLSLDNIVVTATGTLD